MKEVLIAFVISLLLLPSVIAAPLQYAEKEARTDNATRICLDLMDLDFQGEDSDDQMELPPLEAAETSGNLSDAPLQLKKAPEPVVRQSATPEPVLRQPATPEFVVRQPATPEPGVREFVTPEPVERQSATKGFDTIPPSTNTKAVSPLVRSRPVKEVEAETSVPLPDLPLELKTVNEPVVRESVMKGFDTIPPSTDTMKVPPLVRSRPVEETEAETSVFQPGLPLPLKKVPGSGLRESAMKGFDDISPLTTRQVSPLMRSRPEIEAEAEMSVSSRSISPPLAPLSLTEEARLFEAEPIGGASFSSPEIMPMTLSQPRKNIESRRSPFKNLWPREQEASAREIPSELKRVAPPESRSGIFKMPGWGEEEIKSDTNVTKRYLPIKRGIPSKAMDPGTKTHSRSLPPPEKSYARPERAPASRGAPGEQVLKSSGNPQPKELDQKLVDIYESFYK